MYEVVSEWHGVEWSLEKGTFGITSFVEFGESGCAASGREREAEEIVRVCMHVHVHVHIVYVRECRTPYTTVCRLVQRQRGAGEGEREAQTRAKDRAGACVGWRLELWRMELSMSNASDASMKSEE